jgi:hypothetical protein
MSLSDKVEFLDIGLGGVTFKADRRQNPGREYMIKLQDKGKSLDISGILKSLWVSIFAAHNISIHNYHGGLDEKKNLCNSEALRRCC